MKTKFQSTNLFISLITLIFFVGNAEATNRSSSQIESPTDTLYQVVIIGQSQAGGYAISNNAITTDTEPGVYTLTDGPLDSDNSPSSQLVLLTEGDVNDNNGIDPNTETSISGLLRQAKASSNCTNCHFLGSIAYRNGIPINGLVKGGYGYNFGWGQLHGDFIRGYEIAQDSGWYWQPIFVLQHGGAGGTPYGVLVNKMKDDFRQLVDSLSLGTTGYFAACQQREKSPVDFGIEMLKALDTVSHADVVISRDNAVEKTNDAVHMTNWGQRHEGVYFGHHIGRKFIAGDNFDTGLRVGNYFWNGSKLIVPILNAVGPLVGSGDHDMEVYNITDAVTIPGSWAISGSNLEFTPNTIPTGTKDIRLIADSGTGTLRDSRPNTYVTLNNSDGNPYVLYQYLLRFDYEQTITFRDPLGGTQTLNSFSHTVNNGGVLNYYVYYPQDYDESPSDIPVLISLHGLGEFDGSPDIVLSSPFGKGIAELVDDGMDFPLMVISPHGKRNVGGVSNSHWNITLLKQLVDHVVSTYDIDDKRIYMTGFSMGAQASWQYAIQYPEDIAALVPLAGWTDLRSQSFNINLQNPQHACDISQIPTRVWHGTSDDVIPSEESTRMVNAINNCNPTPNPLVEMNLLQGMEHDPLREEVYANNSGSDNIYTWMLQFVKGAENIDEAAPNFISNTPRISNIFDSSFELNVSLDEVGTTYFASFGNGFTPTIDNVINGTGSNLLFHGSIANVQTGSATISNLSPQTDYTVWLVAQDDANPANVQPTLTQVNVRTTFIIDTDPPLPPESVSLVPNVSSITVNWTPSPSADAALHDVYRVDTVWQVVDTTTPSNPMDGVTKRHNLQFENNINDVSGNGVSSNLLNGTTFNSSSKVEGNSSAQFDGSNDYIDLDVGNQYVHAAFNQRTVSMWVYPLSTTGISDLFDEGGATNGIGLRINNGQIQGAVQNQHVIRIISSPINPNEWSHIALIFDNGELRLLINGVEQASDLNVPFSTVNTHGNGGGLGGTNSSNAFDVKSGNFQGFVDDFIITSNALDQPLLKSYYDFYFPVVDSTLTTNTTLLASIPTPANQYVDTQVEDSVDYTYYVVAQDTANNPSAASEFKTARLITEILVPEKPQGLVANLPQENQVVLQWNSVETSGFKDYSVYRSTSNFTEIEDAELIASGVLSNSFVDTTIVSLTTYHYGVVAYNVLNESSDLSDLASITTPDFEPPSAPIGFNGSTIGIFVRLSWSDSLSDDVSQYRLYRNEGAIPGIAAGFLLEELDAATFEFEDQLVDESKEYYYLLTAVDGVGNESSPSGVVNIVVPNLTAPSIPTNLTATFSTEAVNLNWDANSESDLGGYSLWKSTTSNNWPDDFTLLSDVVENSFEDDQVASLSRYYYAVSAFDSVGNTSSISDIIQVNTPDIESPEPVQNLVALAGIGSINIGWEQSTSADVAYHLIYRKLDSVPPLTSQYLIDSVSVDSLNYSDGAVLEGYTYHYMVAAMDNAGNISEGSNSAFAQPQNVTPPNVPSNIQVSLIGNTSVSIDWNDNAEVDIAGYRVYRGLTPGFVPENSSLLADNLPQSSFQDNGLDYGTTYYYAVQAFDNAGNSSGTTDPQSITTNPLPPLGPSLLSTVKVNWNPSGVSSGLPEWNDLLLSVPFGFTTYSNLLDSLGGTVDYNIVIPNARDQSNINNTQDNGASFTGGIYPDEVMRYAGWTSSAGRLYLRNLNPDNTYSIELYSGRNYNSTGNTTFTVNGVSTDVQCYLNKTELVLFENVTPDSNNQIEIVFRENNTWSKGYLNGMIIREFEPASEAVPPATPQGFLANLVGDNQVMLQWNHVTTPGVRDYSVYRSEVPFTQVQNAELIESGIQVNSYLDSAVQSATTYYYAAVAYNILNEASAPSSVASITSPDFEAPLPPSDFAGTLVGTSIGLSWTASVSTDVDRYRLYRNLGAVPLPTNGFLYQELDAATSSFEDQNLEESQEYFYMLTSLDTAGNESVSSGIVSLVIPDLTPPSAPSNFTATPGLQQVSLSWNANTESDLSGYSVWRSAGSNVWPADFSLIIDDLQSTTYNDGAIESKSDYYYAVIAKDSTGNESEVSSILFARTLDFESPAAPLTLTGNLTDNLVALQWTLSSSEDVEFYNLYRNTESAPEISAEFLLQNFDASATEYIDSSVEESSTYFYAVTAVDSTGNESLPTEAIDFLIPDVTPPQAPNNLTATLGTDLISLNWNDNIETDLTGYTVWRSSTSNNWPGDFIELDSGISPSAFDDSSALSDTQYFYAVTAQDSTGNTSEVSNIVSITTPDIEAPLSPTSISGNLVGSSAQVSWGASPSDDVELYHLYRNVGAAPMAAAEFLYQSFDANTTQFLDSNVEESSNYYYFVSAVDSAGNESAPTAPINLLIPDITPPQAPVSLDASLGTASISLNWNDNIETDLAGYTVWRSSISNNWPTDFVEIASGVSPSAYDDGSAQSDTQYFFAVTAQDVAGNTSAVSNVVMITTPDIDSPEAPSNATATAGVGRIDLTWTSSPSSDVASYRIYRSENSAPLVQVNDLLDSLDSSNSAFSDANVTEEITYYYLITAVDEAGNESTPGNVVSASPLNVTPPSVPTGLNAAITAQNQVNLTWNANGEADLLGYILWRSEVSFVSTANADSIAGILPNSSYADLTVQNDTEYFYAIQAIDNASNVSDLSGLIAITTADLVAPEVPQNLTVVPSGNSLVLGWLSNAEEDLDGYNVYGGIPQSDPTTVSNNFIMKVDPSEFPMFSYDLTTNDEGIAYYFAITALDNAGNESPLSEISGGSLPNITPPDAPANLQLSLSDDTSIALDWNDSGEQDFASYTVYRGQTSNFSLDASSLLQENLTESQFTDSALEYETFYYYAVIALDNAGNASSPSTVEGLQTNPVQSGPSLLSTVKVNWVPNGVNSGLPEWNDLTMNLIRGYTSYEVNDSTGTDVDYSVVVAHAQGNSNINGTTDNGAGFTGGVYPNQVMRYAGWTSSSGRIYLRDLNPNNTYNIELYSGRNYNTTGNTSFTVNGSTIDVQCYLNKTELVTFVDVAPNNNNEIEIIFSENNTWSKGYLNGMIIREYADQSAARTVAQNEELTFSEITEMSEDASFEIYPIPTRDGRITLNGRFPNEEVMELEVVDQSGRRVVRRGFDSEFTERISLEVGPGLYFLKLAGNQTLITRKIIVSN